jgi:surfactin synthase thioesterase subunit
MPAHIEVCALELPGHFARRREPLIRDFAELMRTMERDFQPLLDRPFAFFGYSLGALVAFNFARSVRRLTGKEPTQLLVAAAKAPQLPRALSPISHEPKAIFAREVERRYGAFDPIIKDEPDMFDLVLEITRADMSLLESCNYQAEAPFACPVVAIGGKEDRTLEPATLDAWREHTTGTFQTHWLPGGHFFIKNAGQQLLSIARDALGAPAPAAK